MRRTSWIAAVGVLWVLAMGGCEEPTALKADEDADIEVTVPKRAVTDGAFERLADDEQFKRLTRAIFVEVGLPAAARARTVATADRVRLHQLTEKDAATLRKLERASSDLSPAELARVNGIRSRMEATRRQYLTAQESARLKTLITELIERYPGLTSMSQSDLLANVHAAVQPEASIKMGKSMAAAADTSEGDDSGPGWCEAQYGAAIIAASVFYYGALALCAPAALLCVPIAIAGHTAALTAASISYGACKNGY